jgi:type VI secretion system protein ImpH
MRGAATDPVLDELFEEPWRFEFPQAMRVLLRNSEHGEKVRPEDRRYDDAREPVRIGTNQSLGFPASDIQSLDRASRSRPAGTESSAGERARMKVNFLGLTGPSGVLPIAYTEYLLGSADPTGKMRVPVDLVDFFDIFNHRLAMLFYYAWEKYRFPVMRERSAEPVGAQASPGGVPSHDFFGQMLLSLVGLGTDYLQGRQSTPDAFFAKYAGLLAIQPRSACALESILADDLQVPVEVRQFQGGWYPLAANSKTSFSDTDSDSDRLGHGVVVSEEYWSQEFMVRIIIGPLDLPNYRRFLGGGSGLKRLEEICRFYSRDEVVFELQLILMKDQVPAARLSGAASANSQDSQLGWTTWARSVDEAANDTPAVPFLRDVDDVVIRLK